MRQPRNHYWKLKELSVLLRTQPLPVCREVNLEQELAGISTDSRKLKAGELFVALSGANFAGQDFVESAIKQGAVAVVVPGAVPDLLSLAQRYPQVLFLPVADTLAALGTLARARLGKINPVVFAVTGSNGKTTTKEMLAAILAPVFRVHKTAGNFNNLIGLPLTVFAMPDDCQVAVLEMGMNVPGEIAQLTAIARPDYAIITNVAQAHLAGLGSLAAIARAKCEIISGLKPGGVVIYNGDNPYLARQVPATVADCPEVSRPRLIAVSGYGAAETEIKAVEIRHKDEGLSFVFERKDERVPVTLPCWGRHNVMNAVLALAAGTCLAGMGPVPAADSLKHFQMPAGRLQKYEFGDGKILLHDAYNANPDSMAAALTAVSERRGGRFLALVLGDMNELGPESPALHRQLGEKVAQIRPDLLVVVGELAARIASAAQAAGLPAARVARFGVGAFTAVVNLLRERLPAEGLLLVKGSRTLALENIVNPLIADLRLPDSEVLN